MLVTVTGGTGFVGSHSIQALTRRGHRVRLLVRNEANVERALSPLGVDLGGVDVVVGDVTDEASVRRAVRGADAVLHSASVFSFDSRERDKVRNVNVRGTEIVLSAARAAGVGRIGYVSSVVAMMPSRRAPLTADSPIGKPRELYMITKAEAEVVARKHQEEGAPVVISYPSAMAGPNDPHLGDLVNRIRDVLRGLMPMWPFGGLPIGDVRDTAELHAAMLDTPEPGPGRYFGPSNYLTTRELLGTLREVTGRKLPAVYFPATTMLPIGTMAGLAQRVWPWHIPAEYGAVYICKCATRVDDAFNTPFGIQPRPTVETFTDTVRWLHGQGLLSDRQAGSAADKSATTAGKGEKTRVRANP